MGLLLIFFYFFPSDIEIMTVEMLMFAIIFLLNYVVTNWLIKEERTTLIKTLKPLISQLKMGFEEILKQNELRIKELENGLKNGEEERKRKGEIRNP